MEDVLNSVCSNLIESANLPAFIKRRVTSVIDNGLLIEERQKDNKQLIIQVAGGNEPIDVVFSTDDVKIYKVYAHDEWNNKYPYRSIYFDANGNWQNISKVAQTFDVAFLIYLEHKHLGLNSQFATFAQKMLEI